MSSRGTILRVRVTADVWERLQACGARLGIAPSVIAATAIGQFVVGFERGDQVSDAIGNVLTRSMTDAFRDALEGVADDGEGAAGAVAAQRLPSGS